MMVSTGKGACAFVLPTENENTSAADREYGVETR